ncbi:MAG: hypothetical protein ACYDAZ_06985 [Thermoplasmataceae archaeon]
MRVNYVLAVLCTLALIVIGFSGVASNPTIQNNPYNNYGITARSNALEVRYKIESNGQIHFATSYVFLINQTSLEILSNISTRIGTQGGEFSTTYVPLAKTEFALPPGDWHSLGKFGGNGTWEIERKASANREGLVSSSFVNVVDKATDFGYNLRINLVKENGTLISVLEKMETKGKYYFFIPSLIPPSLATQPLTNNLSPSIITPPPGGGGGGIGGTAYLSERDNTAADIHIWHIGTTLSVSSFTSGSSGWSSSLDAAVGTNNPFHNWWLEGSSISTSENSQYTEVTANGSAYFYGVFPLGNYDFWYAFPSVQVNVYSGGTMTADIQNLVLVSGFGMPSPVVWSASTIFNGQFYGYQYSVQFLV